MYLQLQLQLPQCVSVLKVCLHSRLQHNRDFDSAQQNHLRTRKMQREGAAVLAATLGSPVNSIQQQADAQSQTQLNKIGLGMFTVFMELYVLNPYSLLSAGPLEFVYISPALLPFQERVEGSPFVSRRNLFQANSGKGRTEHQVK